MPTLARALALVVLLALTTVAAPGPASAGTPAPPVGPPRYAGELGSFGTADLSPVDQVRDAGGTWYVLDEALQCVQVVPPSGQRRSMFTCGQGGTGTSHIRRARGMGLDRRAQVLWIADTPNHRVLKVALDGTVLATSTAQGAPGGPLSSPGDVTVDDSGRAYVVDARNRVVQLSGSGAFLNQWGTTGTGPRQMRLPLALDYSSVGTPTLYVTDSQNSRIVRWGVDGSWKGTLGSAGQGPGQFTRQPRGVAVDGSGRVYAADVGGNRVNRFAPGGEPLSPLGGGLPYYRSGGTDLFYGGRGLWVDGTTLAVADMWNYRTLLWDLQGRPTGQLGGTPPPPGGHVEPRGVALDAHGNLYVSDYWHQYIDRYDPDGRHTARWGIGRGSEPGTLNLPGGVDVDDTGGFLYIANREERAVDRWRLSDGGFDRRFLMPMTPTGRGWPRDVAVDEAAGLLYAPDEKGRSVAVFHTGTGALLRSVTASGATSSPLGVPWSVAVDEQGALYVADGDRDVVHVHDRAGRWLRDIDARGEPRGLAVRDGVLYVLRANVAAFRTDGRYLWSFGARGPDVERLHAPFVGIEVGPDGAVYVGDTGAGRVTVYRH